MPTTIVTDDEILAVFADGEELIASAVAARIDNLISVGAVRHRLSSLERKGLVERRRADPHESLGSPILPWLWKRKVKNAHQE